MAERDEPLVTLLPRQPGRKEARFGQLLAAGAEVAVRRRRRWRRWSPRTEQAPDALATVVRAVARGRAESGSTRRARRPTRWSSRVAGARRRGRRPAARGRRPAQRPWSARPAADRPSRDPLRPDRPATRPAAVAASERPGPAEQVALEQRAAGVVQRRELLGRLDALADDLEPELAGEREDAAHERGALGARRERRREAAVELDAVGGQLLQPGEGREAGAEVVEGDADAERAQRGELVADAREVDERAALDHLELEPARRQAAAREGLEDGAAQARVDEAARRQVDRDALRRRTAALVPGAQRPRRLAEDPQVELDDEPAVLRGRDERPGTERAEPRVVPPHQRLDRDDLPLGGGRRARAVQREHRLVEQVQLARRGSRRAAPARTTAPRSAGRPAGAPPG